MIFSKDYDKSLWLILSGDKENRRMIADFICRIPKEMYKKICESLIVYEVYKNSNADICFDERYLLDLKGTIKEKEDLSYSYCIDSITGSLEIKSSFIIDREIVNTTQFVLYPMDEVEVQNLTSLENVCLGFINDSYVEQDNCNVADSYVTSFDLIKNLFGRYVVESFDYISQSKHRSLINVNYTPDEFNLGDLKDQDKLNKIIRCRKKSR